MAVARELSDDMSGAASDAGPCHHRQQRRHCRRFAPYTATQEPWSTCIADAVHKALQYTPETRQSVAPMMRKRRLLAMKMQLASRSVVNMAAYIERRERERALTCAPSTDAHTQPGGDGVSAACELEEAEAEAEAGGSEQDAECSMCCICLEKNRPNDARNPVQALQCGHVFHRDCINQWMSYRRCCPVDRIELVEDA